jgi:cytochrome oxidase Cu insertion factor (SCO1/SenC/PrrC family)
LLAGVGSRAVKGRAVKTRPRSREPAKRPGRLTAIIAAVLLLCASAAVFVLIRSETKEQIAQTTVGGPFRLIDSHSRTVTDEDFRGRYLLIYFGYTGCPDVCPTTLASVVQALGLLGKRAAAIQPIFITVDPAHDTPSVMRNYVADFSPRLIGLTGTPAELDAAEKAYHVTVEVTPAGINHSAVLYLMAPDGHFLAPLPADSSAAVIAKDLNHDLT